MYIFKATIQLKTGEEKSWLIEASNKEEANVIARKEAKKKTGGTLLVGLAYIGTVEEK